eukprot:scaffold133457_cov58-Phaeocystis_antarctica.AAC.3
MKQVLPVPLIDATVIVIIVTEVEVFPVRIHHCQVAERRVASERLQLAGAERLIGQLIDDQRQTLQRELGEAAHKLLHPFDAPVRAFPAKSLERGEARQQLNQPVPVERRSSEVTPKKGAKHTAGRCTPWSVGSSSSSRSSARVVLPGQAITLLASARYSMACASPRLAQMSSQRTAAWVGRRCKPLHLASSWSMLGGLAGSLRRRLLFPSWSIVTVSSSMVTV